jgi:nucleoside 2-deoxyribosyltransferase
MSNAPLTIYFAGELFSAKHLAGNAALGEAIYNLSEGKYLPNLPQDIELRSLHPQVIRDTDILRLLEADLAVFNFDGPELDSGTVVEFMFAKFADIPSVILRSDFRSSGDQGVGYDPWNLMASFYPRSISIHLNSMALYKQAMGSDADLPLEERLHKKASSLASLGMNDLIAKEVIAGLDKAATLPPAMPKHLRSQVYQWLALMPGVSDVPLMQSSLKRELRDKVEKGLI